MQTVLTAKGTAECKWKILKHTIKLVNLTKLVHYCVCDPFPMAIIISFSFFLSFMSINDMTDYINKLELIYALFETIFTQTQC